MGSYKLFACVVLTGVVAGCGGSADESSSLGSTSNEGVVAENDSLAAGGAACSSPQVVRQVSGRAAPPIPIAGTPVGSGNLQLPEIREEVREEEVTSPQTDGAAQALAQVRPSVTHRSLSRENRNLRLAAPLLATPVVRSTPVVGGTPALVTSFDGLNLRDQRLANAGNQFTVEPPDQGLCAGNGFVLETVNDVLRVFNTAGVPVTGVIDLNTFYGYPAQFDRTTLLQGPFVTDPSCYYDPDIRRWFHVALTLDVDPVSGAFLGSNHLDVAVSATDDPTGAWVIHQVPVQDDGTDGTPNHGCTLGPCIGDFPHIGADKNGFYITTNEYSLNGPEFISAQIYAFSKTALASGAPTITVVQFDTRGAIGGTEPGFTVWPAISTSGRFDSSGRGVEYFLSSNAAEESNGVPGGTFSNHVILWSAANTKSLNTDQPCVSLRNRSLRSETYGPPPPSDQKAGDVPLADCLNLDCFGFGVPETPEVEGPLDSSDSRMLQVWHADGLVWGALDTVVNVGGEDRAGIAFFVVNPDLERNGGLDGRLVKQGYIAVAGNNVIYPAVAVRPDSKGIMAFTLSGRDHFPSAAYTLIGARGVGDIHVASEGVGPQDGFSEYFIGGDRPRWGDYGAAVTDGSTIFIASEYIAQTCTLAQYLADTSCGGTRVTLGNWATRISALKPW